MSDLDVKEHAEEAIQHHEHGARGIAVLIAVLAALLALAEMGEKSAQNVYMTTHVAVTDSWAFYQAKNSRATEYGIAATMLGDLPNAADPKVQSDIKRAIENEARMRDEPGGDGMKQLSTRARQQEHDRDHALHLYHSLEGVSGILQISIVLASVAVITKIRLFAAVAGVLGAGAAVFGMFVTLAS